MHFSGLAKLVGKSGESVGKLTRRLIPTKSICFAKHMFCHASGTMLVQAPAWCGTGQKFDCMLLGFANPYVMHKVLSARDVLKT
jgi:hypothetical protein